MGISRPAVTIAAAAALTAGGCSPAKPIDRLTGTTWQLTSIESMTSEQAGTTIEDPARYTVTFGEDGKAGFRVDCNRGNSTWKADPAAADSGSLIFGPIALTRMMCPQPSDDTKVAAALGQVRSYLFSDGTLHLSLQADGGIMHWKPAVPGTT
ncbi:MAG: META domain-containing protein [Mycobacterium sp.]